MAKTIKVCVTDVSGNTPCPHCAAAMCKVEYYTAKPVRQQSIQNNMDTKTVITTYTDIYRHVGGICIACADRNEKKKRMVGLLLLLTGIVGSAASMLAALIRSNAAEMNGRAVGAAMNGPMMLMISCILLAIAGLCVFAGSCAFRPGRIISSDALFALFLKRMLKEGHHPGLVYMTPDQAAKLERV